MPCISGFNPTPEAISKLRASMLFFFLFFFKKQCHHSIHAVAVGLRKKIHCLYFFSTVDNILVHRAD